MLGKQKGSKFERDICKMLSLWISEGKNENLFWRSALSGGRSTVAKKVGKLNREQAGDISAVHPDGNEFVNKFYLELKHYKYLGMDRFLLGMPSKLGKFWEMTKREAMLYGKHPVLIVRENNKPILLVVLPPFLACITSQTSETVRITTSGRYITEHVPNLVPSHNNDRFLILRLTDLLTESKFIDQTHTAS